MTFEFETEEKYAAMIPFLRQMGLELPRNKKVWNAFLKWSTLFEAVAFYAVTYGTSPLVRILEPLDPTTSNGHFEPSNPQYINIKWVFAANINAALKDGRAPAIEDTKAFEALLLHELCHWGRWFTNSSDGQYEFGDSGDMFKREAYKDPYRPHLG
jgi:hypothetical protein